MKFIFTFLLVIFSFVPTHLFASAGSALLTAPVTIDSAIVATTAAPATVKKETTKKRVKQLRRIKNNVGVFLIGLLIGIAGIGLMAVARSFIGFYPVFAVVAGVLGFVCALIGFALTGLDFTQVIFG